MSGVNGRPSFPLYTVREGERVLVERIGGKKDVKEKFINMGLIPGTSIEVINGHRDNPYLLEFNHTRVMIDFELVKKIFVFKE